MKLRRKKKKKVMMFYDYNKSAAVFKQYWFKAEDYPKYLKMKFEFRDKYYFENKKCELYKFFRKLCKSLTILNCEICDTI